MAQKETASQSFTVENFQLNQRQDIVDIQSGSSFNLGMIPKQNFTEKVGGKTVIAKFDTPLRNIHVLNNFAILQFSNTVCLQRLS
jgi:hypothetical protein